MTATDQRYTIISADTHAGANHETYRSYLDPAYLDDFDAWRNKYKNCLLYTSPSPRDS